MKKPVLVVYVTDDGLMATCDPALLHVSDDAKRNLIATVALMLETDIGMPYIESRGFTVPPPVIYQGNVG